MVSYGSCIWQPGEPEWAQTGAHARNPSIEVQRPFAETGVRAHLQRAKASSITMAISPAGALLAINPKVPCNARGGVKVRAVTVVDVHGEPQADPAGNGEGHFYETPV
jgi:hypothetical protein